MHENEEEPVAACKSDGCGTADHPVTIDEVFSDHVGNFGRGQILHFLLTSLGWMLQALHILVPVFADRSPVWNYNLNTNSNVSNGHGHNLLLCAPICTDYTEFNKRLGDEFMFHLPTAISIAVNYSTVIRSSAPPCSASNSSWSWLDKKESTISEWNLVSDRVYLQGFAQSAFFIGSIVGSSVFGHLSDWKLGRRGALAFSTISLCVFGMLTAVSPNYQLYVLLRALTGASTGGLAVSSYVLGMELIGPSCRANVALSSLYFFPIGSFLLVAVASAYRMLASGSYNWRYLYVVTSIPSVLYCLSVLPFINESPRWYLVHGHTDKAMEVLMSICNQNGRNLPKGLVLVTCHRSKDLLGETGNRAQQDGSLVQVFKRRDTRYRMLIVVVSWFACALGYYVFNLNVGNLGTNLYLSVMLYNG
ncbi:hypothetical protein KP509_12G086100 [Ceratopteris richardii]|uniref:Major facilitator superfamily (MFS) profile domain-containing protein n=1 Tax=Ceratopteris richardii TaxID=49495 RepID=A0A8T2TQG8_CERRI|nr:hypothetical protein KP509_12G086100 [Ceratopteris richardii]